MIANFEVRACESRASRERMVKEPGRRSLKCVLWLEGSTLIAQLFQFLHVRLITQKRKDAVVGQEYFCDSGTRCVVVRHDLCMGAKENSWR